MDREVELNALRQRFKEMEQAVLEARWRHLERPSTIQEGEHSSLFGWFSRLFSS